jgi:hypothetical protein
MSLICSFKLVLRAKLCYMPQRVRFGEALRCRAESNGVAQSPAQQSSVRTRYMHGLPCIYFLRSSRRTHSAIRLAARTGTWSHHMRVRAARSLQACQAAAEPNSRQRGSSRVIERAFHQGSQAEKGEQASDSWSCAASWCSPCS